MDIALLKSAKMSNRSLLFCYYEDNKRERCIALMSLTEKLRLAFIQPIYNGYLGKGHKVVKKPVSGLVGYKKVYLTMPKTFKANSKVKMRAFHYGGEYPLSGDATCQTSHNPNDGFNHTVPEWNCTCGFYSYKTINQAFEHDSLANMYRNPGFVVEAAISGKFIQYKKGYRYEHQRITAIYVEDCSHCSQPASAIITSDREWRVSAVCLTHALQFGSSKNRITLTEFAAAASLSYSTEDLNHAPVQVLSTYQGKQKFRPSTVKELRPNEFTARAKLGRKFKELFSTP